METTHAAFASPIKGSESIFKELTLGLGRMVRSGLKKEKVTIGEKGHGTFSAIAEFYG